MARRRRAREDDRKCLTPLPSGRTAEVSFVEKFEEEPEPVIMDDLQRDGRKATPAIRYPDPDDDVLVPSGRLRYNS